MGNTGYSDEPMLNVSGERNAYSPVSPIPIVETVDQDNLEAAQEMIEAFGANDPSDNIAIQMMQRNPQYTSNTSELIWESAKSMIKMTNFLSK